MVTTRKKKSLVNTILGTWKREDDPDDYFDMWYKHYKKNPNTENPNDYFKILNYNLLTELQEIKDLITIEKLSSPCSFKNIKKLIKSYSFLSSLANIIDEEEEEDIKKKLFIEILKNLIKIYILLTKSIFDETIFPQIGRRTCLYRSWRNNSQLESMKKQNNKGKPMEIHDILTTDNYLSTSLNKESALKFYKTASADNRKNFILWEIEIPTIYPNLHVSTELEEVLLHIGSKLEFIGIEEIITEIGDGAEKYNIEVEKYKYIEYDNSKTNEVLNKFNDALNILEQVLGEERSWGERERKRKRVKN